VGNQYLDSFKHAVKNLNRCTDDEEPDYRDLLAAFTSGMASIEAFVNKRVRRHLDPSRVDVEQALGKTHLETKVFDWMPRIYGLQVDKGKPPWQDYVKLRRFRNESYIHPKAETAAVSDKEFCQRLNLFRTGIARLLLDLHYLGDYGAPPELVKYAYWPEVEIAEG
jgi:hypothetical protein